MVNDIKVCKAIVLEFYGVVKEIVPLNGGQKIIVI